jgi:gamma-glutamyltranspeptidase/glutathione hydrolase
LRRMLVYVVVSLALLAHCSWGSLKEAILSYNPYIEIPCSNISHSLIFYSMLLGSSIERIDFRGKVLLHVANFSSPLHLAPERRMHSAQYNAYHVNTHYAPRYRTEQSYVLTLKSNEPLETLIDKVREFHGGSTTSVSMGGGIPSTHLRTVIFYDPDWNPIKVTEDGAEAPRETAASVARRQTQLDRSDTVYDRATAALANTVKSPAENDALPRHKQFYSRARGSRLAAVASDNPIAARVATIIVRNGGSAADALIAANAAISVLEPMNSGPGGDLFAMVYEPPTGVNASARGAVYGLNGSGPLGSKATKETITSITQAINYTAQQPVYSQEQPIPTFGAAAGTTVPGAVAAWCALHERYGKLPWKDLFAPAISLAVNGFNVSVHAWRNWNTAHRATQAMQSGMLTPQQYVDFMSVYAPGGTAPLPGEFMRNPALGRTLSRLAEGGCEEFYTGSIAEEFGAYMESVDGLLTAQDLKDFWNSGGAQFSDISGTKGSKDGTENTGKTRTKGPAEWSQPLCTSYRDKYHVHGMSGNSQALAGLQMLSVLDEYDPAHLRANPLHRTYLLVALKRIVYIYDRAVYAGDVPRNASAVGEGCEARGASLRRVLGLTPAEIKSLIDESFQAGKPFPIDKVVDAAAALHPGRLARRVLREERVERGGDTVGFVVRDDSGLTLSVLQSNGNAFGSFLTPPDLGFALHNRGSKFNLLDPDQHPNALKPGRRVLHTLSPWVVTHADSGLPFLAVAMKGGDRQPYAFVQVLSNFIDLQMSLPEAIAAPRFRHAVSTDASPHQPVTTYTALLGIKTPATHVVTSLVNTTIEVERGFSLSDGDMAALQCTYGVTLKVRPVDAPFEDSGFGVCQVLFQDRQESPTGNSNDISTGPVTIEVVTDALRKPGQATAMPTSEPAIYLCAIAKHEDLYIEEWVHYHLLIGFHQVHIYDNNDYINETDPSLGNITRALPANYPGQVFVYPFPGRRPTPLQAAFNDFIEASREQHAYVVFADVDDFLVLRKHTCVSHYLREVAFAQRKSLALPWLTFGSSHALHYDDRPVLQRFQLRKDTPEPTPKHILYIPDLIRLNNAFSPLLLEERGLYNSRGISLNYTSDHSASHGKHNKHMRVHMHVPSDTTMVEVEPLAVFHHYATKSADEYVRKVQRGTSGPGKRTKAWFAWANAGANVTDARAWEANSAMTATACAAL